MKGILVQTTLFGEENLKRIVESGTMGINSKPIGSQPPKFKDNPLVFCSYICKGYSETYGNREGIAFETDAPVVYASPVDTFNFLRGGNWLGGHERFLFSSIEEMLDKYPTSADFKKDFQKYFRSLKPREVYPKNSEDFAQTIFEADYCLSVIHSWVPGCNEVTFSKPLKIKNYKIFKSKEELDALYLP